MRESTVGGMALIVFMNLAVTAWLYLGAGEPPPTAVVEPPTVSRPAPAATAMPTAVAVQGLGVSRAQIQTSYTRAGFVFGALEFLETGEPHVIGRAVDGGMIDLIGDSRELTKVIIAVPVLADNAQSRQLSAVYIVALISHVAPAHVNEISEWLGRRIGDLADGELVTGTYRSKVAITLASDGIAVGYSISRA